jgi:hypothetical protein
VPVPNLLGFEHPRHFIYIYIYIYDFNILII